MHRPKPHIRVMQEKEMLDGYSRLQQIGPLITIPRTVDRIPNMKKVQILEDRYTQIEKDNRLLLEKITNIMNSTNIKLDKPKRISSLNTRKKTEQEQIRRDNLILFKHITTKKSSYSKQQYDKEWNQTKQYFYNLSGLRPSTQKNKGLVRSFEF
ncbi:unnamed protein product (macronuclear) [Paramecium tetraurelia]|uniref:Cilia- and flagella-associated protein 97 n=1 Tax=Paramecium tetraurelia TaxID=5888 RepID=A0D0Y0_PARTE|nr:uncharacterized protein GSPATT00012249001 [Paramecium tetraurelia]CAK76697.1 unnamed protein product [Paramecium tetraurelia]|eukprot:XP_001444094.1 hypothetical protein (macronuclear) [Paramecium tetraurelia strain d4-2]